VLDHLKRDDRSEGVVLKHGKVLGVADREVDPAASVIQGAVIDR
jgi:hypothetical protein